MSTYVERLGYTKAIKGYELLPGEHPNDIIMPGDDGNMVIARDFDTIVLEQVSIYQRDKLGKPKGILVIPPQTHLKELIHQKRQE